MGKLAGRQLDSALSGCLWSPARSLARPPSFPLSSSPGPHWLCLAGWVALALLHPKGEGLEARELLFSPVRRVLPKAKRHWLGSMGQRSSIRRQMPRMCGGKIISPGTDMYLGGPYIYSVMRPNVFSGADS